MHKATTVLVGKLAQGDVTALIRELGDERDPAFGKAISGSTVRSRVASGWALLLLGEHPLKRDETVYKVSRHNVSDGQVWTWFGGYRHADFPELRDGTYLGYGLLVLNASFDVGEAFDLVSAGLAQVEAASARSDGSLRPIDDLQYDVRITDTPLALAPARGGGLSAASQHNIFYDVTGLKGPGARATIINIIEEGLTGHLIQYGQLVIGNSKRLRAAVETSGAYALTQPAREWGSAEDNRVPPVGGAMRGGEPADKSASSTHERAEPMGEADAPDVLRSDILRLEDKFDDFLAQLRKVPPSELEKKERRRRWRREMLLSATAVMVFLILAFLLFKDSPFGRISPQVPPLENKTAQHDTSDPPAAPEAPPAAQSATCEPAPIPPGTGKLETEAARLVLREQECLAKQGRTLTQRKLLIDRAAARGSK